MGRAQATDVLHVAPGAAILLILLLLLLLLQLLLLRLEDPLGDVVRVVLPGLARRHPPAPPQAGRCLAPGGRRPRPACTRGGGGGGVAAAERPAVRRVEVRPPAPPAPAAPLVPPLHRAGPGPRPRPRPPFGRAALRSRRQAAVSVDRRRRRRRGGGGGGGGSVPLPGRPRAQGLSVDVLLRSVAAGGGWLHGGLGARQAPHLPADHPLPVQEAGVFLLARVRSPPSSSSRPSLLAGRPSALGAVAAAVLATREQ